MSNENLTMGQVCDELQALGTASYVDLSGKVWHLKYGGSVDLADWLTAEPFADTNQEQP